ncbi:hypothetical protein B0H14DRAFT_2341287, partial [Mycena olivaceomarginata]
VSKFESPLWAGRLPLGEPAGGSLTADEYKFAVTTPWAMMVSKINIPIIWDRSLPLAIDDYKTASSSFPRRLKAWEAKMQKNRNAAKPPQRPKEPIQRIRAEEDQNFLRFAAALKIIVGSSIHQGSIESMKPNHHWVVHIFEQIQDFGPVYSFWAFLSERLNKILKNMKSNNWTGGRVEVSMMRQFHRNTGLDSKAILFSTPLHLEFICTLTDANHSQ